MCNSGPLCCSVLSRRRYKQALYLTHCVRHWSGFPGRLLNPRRRCDVGCGTLQQWLYAPRSVQISLTRIHVKDGWTHKLTRIVMTLCSTRYKGAQSHFDMTHARRVFCLLLIIYSVLLCNTCRLNLITAVVVWLVLCTVILFCVPLDYLILHFVLHLPLVSHSLSHKNVILASLSCRHRLGGGKGAS